MTFNELVKECARKTGCEQRVVANMATTLFSEILLQLCRDNVVKIPRFGTIKKKRRHGSPNDGYIKIDQSRLVTELFNMTAQSKDK